MPLFDQVELLCQAIVNQGRQEAENILQQAREQASRLVAEEQERQEEVTRRNQTEVRAQAELAARNLTDKASLESKRRVAEGKEAILTEIFQTGLERLLAFRRSPDYPDWLRRRLVAAMGELQGDKFRIAIHPEEAAWLTPALLDVVRQETGCRVELETDPDTPVGGFMAIRADGRLRLDQTFPGILDRKRETLRRELAKLLWEG